MRFRPSLWLTVFSAISLVILCGLGFWQMQRLDWKQGLIAEISAAQQGDPVLLPAELADPPSWRFRKVAVTGTFLHHAEAHRTGPAEAGKIGYRVFTPLRRTDGGIVMVERGWVPERLKDPAQRAGGQLDMPVTVVGMLRLPEVRNTFTPTDNAAKNIWYAVDPRAMAASAGVTAPEYYVVQETADVQWPRAAPSDLNLRNNHLGYAITWFSLGVVLLVIWLLMGFRRGRGEG